MSGLVWILALAVAVQLAAGTLAMMRLRSAGHRLGWFLLAAALLIMTGRRAVSLWSQLLHPDPSALAWGQEIVGLAISLLMLAAVLALGPWFQQAQRDATDAMRFATAFQDSETRYRQLVTAAREGIALIDPSGRLQLVNPRLCEMLGREPEELLGKPTIGWFSDTERPHVAARFEARRAGTSEQYDSTICRPDGREVEVLISATPIFSDDGTFRGSLATFTDITERKKAERALRTSEERYRSLFNSISDSVFVHGITADGLPGRFTEVNDIACQRLGYTRAELLEMTPADIDAPEGWAHVSEVMARVEAEKGAVWEGVHVSKDGRHIPVEISIHLFDLDGKPTILTTARDISDRKQAERELARMAREHRLILESAGDGLCGVDTQGRITFINPAGAAMIGWDPTHVIGKSLHQVCHHSHPDGRPYPEDECPILCGLTSGSPHHRGSEVYIRRDGSTFPVEYLTTPIMDQGRLTGGVVVFQDVGTRLRLETQLQRAQKMEALGQFASGIAHDFNNLVMVVAGTTELAQQRLPADNPLQEDLGTIRCTSQRASELTRGLLAFARRQVLQREDAEINTLLGGMLPMLRRLVPESIALSFQPDLAAGVAHVDPGQIEQVVMNLCVNARDAMPGGGLLTIRTGKSEIEETYRVAHPWAVPGAYSWFSVQDTGQGMDEATIARIFEPFFTTKEQGQGTGLGLATVYGIVKQHGGMIDVLSRPGEGSMFTVYLPWIGEDVTRRAADEIAATASLAGTEHILLVEDHDDLRSLLARLLADHGYRVAQAVHGADALKLLAKADPEFALVVTDVVMPVMGGLDLYLQVREVHPNLAFIFSSGYTAGEGPDELPRGPRLAFLTKPYSTVALLTKIRELLDDSEKPPASPREP
ncbi:MAG TPA: PAS domain S-box protein [Thermoanaerobaculaceae bacterium]|nr:PAS domain S-box protein [Thermoanaerobaculaceae bacterium]